MKSHTLEHVQAVSQDWIWGDVIPAGVLTLISGPSGVGKSFLMQGIAAQITRGIRGPQPSRLQPSMSVLLALDDEDLAKTVRPRLDACGARQDCIFLLSASSLAADVSGADLDRRPIWERQLSNLVDEVKRLREKGRDIRLVVIDPVELFFNDDDDRKGRARLGSELAQFAARTGMAVVCLSDQFGPDLGRPAPGRPSCYSIIAKSARSIWMVKQSANELDRRKLVPVKTNLCQPRACPTAAIGPGIQWGLEKITTAIRTPQSELNRVVDWARMQLEGRTILWENLLRWAFRAGIAERTLERAIPILDCVKLKDEETGKRAYRLRDKPPPFVPPPVVELSFDSDETDDAGPDKTDTNSAE